MRLKAAVLGDPVGHSLSPLLHGYWLKRYGIDGEYLPRHISAEALPETLKKQKQEGYAGCNLTIPHKETALTLLDELSDEAKAIGAVNTVIVREDGSLFGTNTDAEGFIKNLKHSEKDLSSYLDHCLILGAGGAAKAVFYALRQAGATRISISNRNRARAEMYGVDVVDWKYKEAALENVTLLVNTTSLGMKGQPELELSLEALPKQALVTDIVYQPLKTELLLQAQARGNKVVTGIGMLIYQAVFGFEQWFGVRPEVDEPVFTLLEAHLESRAS